MGNVTTAISVVIPAFNAAPFIDRALASVAAQHRPPNEVIVIDDGSADATAERAEAWRKRLTPAMLMVIQQSNRGLSGARNAGIDAASGDLIALLDADDSFLPNHLATLAPAFDLVPELGLCFGDLRRRGPLHPNEPAMLDPIRDGLVRISTPLDSSGLCLLNPAVRALYLHRPCILPTSWLISRPLAIQVGGFDAGLRYAEDIDLLWRLLAETRAAWINRVTAIRFEHDMNSTNAAHGTRNEPILLRCLARLRQHGGAMTAAEANALDALIDLTTYEVMFDASSRGPLSWWRARRQIRRLIGRQSAWNTRILARSLVRANPWSSEGSVLMAPDLSALDKNVS